MPAIAVIYNPNSRKNRRAPPGRPERLRRILGPTRRSVRNAPSPKSSAPVVGRLLEQGVEYLVSAGGDGSLHWAMNEVTRQFAARSTIYAQPALLPTNGGTIDFVARKVGITGNSERIVLALTRALAGRQPPELVTLDSLEITGTELGPDGRELPFRRIGFSLAGGRHRPALLRQVLRRAGARRAWHRPSGAARRGIARRRRAALAIARARAGLRSRRVPPDASASGHRRTRGAEPRARRDPRRRLRHRARRRIQSLPARASSPGVLHFQAGALSPAEIIRALPDLWRGGAIRGKQLVEVGGVRMSVIALDEPLYPIIDGESFGPLKKLEVRLGPQVQVPRVSA